MTTQNHKVLSEIVIAIWELVLEILYWPFHPVYHTTTLQCHTVLYCRTIGMTVCIWWFWCTLVGLWRHTSNRVSPRTGLPIINVTIEAWRSCGGDPSAAFNGIFKQMTVLSLFNPYSECHKDHWLFFLSAKQRKWWNEASVAQWWGRSSGPALSDPAVHKLEMLLITLTRSSD